LQLQLAIRSVREAANGSASVQAIILEIIHVVGDQVASVKLSGYADFVNW
jgi:hypothetical protein